MIKFRKFERSPKEKGWGFGHIRIDDFKIEHLNYQIDAYMIAVPPGRTTIRFWKRTTVKIAKREFTIPGFTLIDWEHRSLSSAWSSPSMAGCRRKFRQSKRDDFPCLIVKDE